MNRYNYPLQDNMNRYNNYPMKDSHEYIIGDDEICDDLRFQEKKFIDDFQQIKFDYLNDCNYIFNHPVLKLIHL
jgi:hypothetical protein